VPPTSTWFTDDPDVQEYDDDIAIESEKTSLKCPITLVTFNDPVTSTKCPHSFEREAILSMIQRSSARVGPGSMQRGRGTRAVQCPCCEQMLAVNDLKQDPILVRQVQRFKARQAREEESGEDEVGSNDESLVLMREAIGTAQATRIKKENMARRRTRQEDSEDEDSEDEES
jgi:SUMO ligase MMS21 Smc5/6 complex component